MSKTPALPTVAAAPAASPAGGIRPQGLPLLRLGFRPFYLGAAAFALLAVPAWVAMMLGHPVLPPGLPPLLWHAHEMIYGFAVAVIVGFLLTAGRAWTGLDTPRGADLGALALLWLAARVAAVTGPQPLYAMLDFALLPAVAVALTLVLLRANNRRNLPLAAILLLLAAANGVFHLATLGLLGLSPLTALHAALALVVVVECVIAGRVVPAFTQNATPGLKLAPQPRLGPASMAATVAALAVWVFEAPAALAAPLLAAAAVLQAARAWGWQPRVTAGRPILWVLHASYAWIPVGLALLAASAAGWVSGSAGVHALGVGATGGLIVAMITRTARGHTGRPLLAGRAEVAAYALVLGAAVLRSLGQLLPAAWLPPAPALVAAAVAWSAAFALYLWVFTPWLLRTRLDGKDG